jgi:DNA topoisomerase-1
VNKLDEHIGEDAKHNDSAAALLLIRRLGLRPGSDTDTKAVKEAHGATNLSVGDVSVANGVASFNFTGKKGVGISLTSSDSDVVNAVQSRISGRDPSERLFNTNERLTAAYFKQYAPAFKLKDLRTLKANEVALGAMATTPDPSTAADLKKAKLAVGDIVSKALGNTRDVALASYVNPVVFARWEAAVA